jgi:tetratricopeptide (TPR) repeat protein
MRCAEAAAGVLTRGTVAWFRAVAEVVEACCLHGDHARARAWSREASAWEPEPELPHESSADQRAEQIACLARAGVVLMYAGRLKPAEDLSRQIDRLTLGYTEIDRRVAGRVRELRALQAYYAGDPEGNLVGLEGSYAAYEQAGDVRNACQALGHIGFAYLELGAWERAEHSLREAQQMGERMGLQYVVAVTLKNLGLVMAHRGDVVQARDLERRAAQLFESLGVPRMEGAARRSLASIAMIAGDPIGAEDEARRAVALLAAAPPKRIGAYAVLSRALLLSRPGDLLRAREALDCARSAMELLASVGMCDENESLVRLAYAEALEAAGDHEAACRAIASAREHLLERAGRITDDVLSKAFVQDLPDNARTLELAREWLGPVEELNEPDEPNEDDL